MAANCHCTHTGNVSAAKPEKNAILKGKINKTPRGHIAHPNTLLEKNRELRFTMCHN